MHRFLGLLLLTGCLGTHSLVPSARGFEIAPGEEKKIFDGESLKGWAITDFAGHGEVEVEDGILILRQGYVTGVHWTNNLPRPNYEISLEAKRVIGNDFFCALTFPIAGTNATLIVGGWGGGVVGISSIDGYDASENETTQFKSFKRDQWYAIRLRVTDEKLEAWIDDEAVVDVKTAGKKFGLRSGPIEESIPLGIASYETVSHLRNIKMRKLPDPAAEPATPKASE